MVTLPLILLFGFVGGLRLLSYSDSWNVKLMAILGQFAASARHTTLPKDTPSTVPSIVHSRFGTVPYSVSPSLQTLPPPLSSR